VKFAFIEAEKAAWPIETRLRRAERFAKRLLRVEATATSSADQRRCPRGGGDQSCLRGRPRRPREPGVQRELTSEDGESGRSQSRDSVLRRYSRQEAPETSHEHRLEARGSDRSQHPRPELHGRRSKHDVGD